jgi:hypothetical protein
MFLMLLTPGGMYLAVWDASEIDSRSIFAEIQSPDTMKKLIVYYTPPREGGDIWINVKLRYRFFPFVVRHIYTDTIDFDWYSTSDQDVDYEIEWRDNDSINLEEPNIRLAVNTIRFLEPEIYNELSSLFDLMFAQSDG